jgi:hypothetical protein
MPTPCPVRCSNLPVLCTPCWSPSLWWSCGSNSATPRTRPGAEASAIADLLRDSTAVPAEFRPAVQQSLDTYTEDVVNDEFPRMRRGEHIEQQSPELTAVWESYLKVQPESRNEIAFFDHAIVRLDDLSANRKQARLDQ